MKRRSTFPARRGASLSKLPAAVSNAFHCRTYSNHNLSSFCFCRVNFVVSTLRRRCWPKELRKHAVHLA